MKTPEILKRVAHKIELAGGKPFLVGGAVRDHLMGWESKDLDVEVFGLSINQLTAVLRKFGYVRQVGKAFGVLKLFAGDEDFDFSLPRQDIKTGAGHKGFTVKTDSLMSFRQAASRRDFTINAMGMNIISGQILDEFGGRKDLSDKILRAVDPETFVEDPLRVLRGIQFAARFDLDVVPDTLSLFRRLVPSLKELPKERIFEELKKLLLKAEKPSVGFRMADQAGVIAGTFPELQTLRELSGGNVWTHTMNTLDEAAKLRSGDQFHDICLTLAAICRQLDKKGLETTRPFLDRLTTETKLIDTVASLAKNSSHDIFLRQESQVEDGVIRRLALRVNVSLLLKLAKADYFAGRNDDKNLGFPAGEWLAKRLQSLGLLKNQKITPVLMGRHLIELGLKPGPKFGQILKEAFELQLDGQISSIKQALKWAEENM